MIRQTVEHAVRAAVARLGCIDLTGYEYESSVPGCTFRVVVDVLTEELEKAAKAAGEGR